MTEDLIYNVDGGLRSWWPEMRWAPSTLALPRLVVLVGKNGAGKSLMMGKIQKQVMRGRNTELEMSGQITNRGRLLGTRGHTLKEMLADPRFVSISIDGVDQGLHLSRQYEVMAEIMAAVKARPELRVVCTCYSPYALEKVPYKSIFVMARAPDGLRYIKPLTDAPGFDLWSKGLTAGELWATTGEDWVFAPAIGGKMDEDGS